MPGPAVHHLIADRLTAEIHFRRGLGEDTGDETYEALQKLVAPAENLPYLYVGCHGPDPWFFNLKDANGAAGELMEMYNDVADLLHEFKEALLSVVPQPVLDALDAFAEEADEVIEDSVLLSEIKQTFEQIGLTLRGFLAVLTTGLKSFVSDFNLYDVLEHPYRDGASEGEWWWFDAMHYRRTGKFTEAMLEQTRDMSSPHHLYALGYLTHVAADTVGHAYVNLWSGGAYRSHGQRHKTGENYQDVRTMLDVDGVDFNVSKLHALYNFNFTGVVSDDEPEEHPRMPPDLARFIADTLNRIYQEEPDHAPEYAKAITASDVDDTYRLWYRFMRGFTDTGTLPPPVAYSLSDELVEVWEKTLENLGDAGDILANAVDEAGEGGILAIFAALGMAILGAVLAALAIADAIVGAVVTLGVSTIRAAACLIYEQLYNAFQNLRLALALNGLGFPMREHLDAPQLRQFINPGENDPTGADAAQVVGREPLLRFTADWLPDPADKIFHQERHLVYPLTDGEKVAATPPPPSYINTPPTHYAFGDLSLDRLLLDDLVSLQNGPGNDEETMRSVLGRRGLGNALQLSGALYERWLRGESLPDFNLDADRGYGYLCWAQPGERPHEPQELKTNDDAADPTVVQLEVLP